ncbi:hypothetical protein CEJ86_09680 [Sinorhizobium meliloti]|uniref:Uncharacterized protein n=1 Tax=Rhizobium meliloti TaxID=382 RepID=A0A2J0Z611_RHIML|nr:hypothetical protein CEJ86_09680 [Sinorhizobium meliloti]
MRDRGCAATTSKRNGTLHTGVTRDRPRRLAIFTVYESAPRDRTLSTLIPVSGLDNEHGNEATKQAAAGGPNLDRA